MVNGLKSPDSFGGRPTDPLESRVEPIRQRVGSPLNGISFKGGWNEQAAGRIRAHFRQIEKTRRLADERKARAREESTHNVNH